MPRTWTLAWIRKAVYEEVGSRLKKLVVSAAPHSGQMPESHIGDRQSALLRSLPFALVAISALAWLLFVGLTLPLALRGVRYDFAAFWYAGRALAEGNNPYRIEQLYQSDTVFPGYVYPPIMAMLILPLGVLPRAYADTIWYFACLGMLVISATAIVGITRRLFGPGDKRIEFAVFGLGMLLFYPVWTEMKLGQVNTPIFCLTVSALALATMGRQIFGGVLLGTAVALKLIPLPLAVLAFWIGWRRMALSAAATFIVLQVLTLITLPELTISYWTEEIVRLRTLDPAGDASLVGLTRRAGAYAGVELTPVAMLVAAAVLGMPFLLYLRDRDPELRPWYGSLMIAGMAVGMPYVESHHMLWLSLPLWLLATLLWRTGAWWSLAVFGVSFLLLSQPYRLARIIGRFVELPFEQSIMGLYVLGIGALVLYLLMLYSTPRRRFALPSTTRASLAS